MISTWVTHPAQGGQRIQTARRVHTVPGCRGRDQAIPTTQTAPDSPFNPQAPFEQGWCWWYFNDPRVFDDRIVWSVDWLPAGTYEFTYQFVPVLPGEYKVIPTRAYQNYFPEVQGNSAGDVFEITK